ncbi:MAG: hypothetical protein ACM3ZR_06230 [Pseudomonadota bacterium]
MLTAFYEMIDASYIISGILMNCLERLINILGNDVYSLFSVAALAFLPFLLVSLIMSAYISDRST